MELNRSIDKNLYYKILEEYNEEHINEINSLYIMLNELEKNLKKGEEMIQSRYEYHCGDKLRKIFENDGLNFDKLRINRSELIKRIENYIDPIDNGNDNDIMTNYSLKSYLIDDYARCKRLSRTKFENVYDKIKNEFNTINQNEQYNINKCFVLEFEDENIKKCLYKEFNKYKINWVKDAKKYYDELKLFGENIYY
jgi:hypothetical protein